VVDEVCLRTHTIRELEEASHAVLDEGVYGFVAGGSGDEYTLRANVAAFDRYVLRQHVLTSNPPADLRASVLGAELLAPLYIAPMGGQRMIHADGELATARAARDVGIGYMLSAASSVAMEEVAAASGPARWFQLYWHRDRKITADLARRAEESGYRALCLTVDAPVQGHRRREARGGFRRPATAPFANYEPYAGWLEADTPGRSATLLDAGDPAALGWDALSWLCSVTDLPVVVKGILDPADTRAAVEHGARGIIVSNHGGRQLDGVQPAIDALRTNVEAAGPVPVLFDSGIRSARDIVVALASGARAVGIGRPVLWALAVAGERGVREQLGFLVEELQRSLTLMGVRSSSALTPHHLRSANS
jgi:4-hydroxymandelate oxidase